MYTYIYIYLYILYVSWKKIGNKHLWAGAHTANEKIWRKFKNVGHHILLQENNRAKKISVPVICRFRFIVFRSCSCSFGMLPEAAVRLVQVFVITNLLRTRGTRYWAESRLIKNFLLSFPHSKCWSVCLIKP